MPLERHAQYWQVAPDRASYRDLQMAEVHAQLGGMLGSEHCPAPSKAADVRSRTKRLSIALALAAFVSLVVWAPIPFRKANIWSILDRYLKNLGHFDAKGKWIADTWDHFKIPDCDPGPPIGATQQVPFWVNESVWVPDENPDANVGGGHYVFKPKQHFKEVPLLKSPAQADCSSRQESASRYHKKLIAQHYAFADHTAKMEALLQWQAAHDCSAQNVNVKLQLATGGGYAIHEPQGDESGAHCQKVITNKGYECFTWSSRNGCMTTNNGGGALTWKAVESPGSYSGYRCSSTVSPVRWIQDKAQQYTLLDGIGLQGVHSDQGVQGSVLCVMLIDPYSADADMVILQRQFSAGIFACDKHAVYSSQKLRFADGLETRKIYASQLVELGGEWSTPLDTDLTMAFWRAVLQDSEWMEVKWVVRAAPDTIFYVDLLRPILRQQDSITGKDPVYLVDSGKEAFPPYFQVFSHAALGKLGLHSRECFWQMRYWGDKQWSQAVWIDKCMTDTVHARRAEIPDLIGSSTGPDGCKEKAGVAYHPVAVDEQRSCL
mmetsp:Transcript_70704/g.165813  ORF Transcript_70704/g.165813 Transcript_70704/m.165813 type:complete len:547 (+) Transcript_70704:33-1673(+)